jgi:hypothetical protein
VSPCMTASGVPSSLTWIGGAAYGVLEGSRKGAVREAISRVEDVVIGMAQPSEEV